MQRPHSFPARESVIRTNCYYRYDEKEGFNPIKKEKETALRRELFVDYEIPYGRQYRDFLDLEILSENDADEITDSIWGNQAL